MTGRKTDKRFSFRRLIEDRGGNFAMMTAILLPVTLGTVGVAMDYNNLIQVKSALQDAADSAALAAASAMAHKGMSDTEAMELAKNFYAAQYKNLRGTADAVPGQEDEFAMDLGKNAVASVNKVSGKNLDEYDVTVKGTVDVPTNAFTSLLGFKSVKVSVVSTAKSQKEEKSALSMYLVLDESGSMAFATNTILSATKACKNYYSTNWGNKDKVKASTPCFVTKMSALKTAAGVMFSTLEAEAVKGTFVRLGAASYNAGQMGKTDIGPGTATASKYVTALPVEPSGGTDALAALDTAIKAIMDKKEADEHEKNGVSQFSRYIVLMTDGEMTGNSASWNSTIDNNVRKKCAEAKKADIRIFTVAFMAPQRGKDLLEACASSLTDAKTPDDMSGLVSAFQDIAKEATKATTRLVN
ncbi:TadE/TadG family type IV pilus assembly protein [Peteryoungia ipomoeae]|nr:TadE/TadG family type IV pilus assembly protein [Peteryoungia ipomoeae]